jgi:hypothetical protein
VNFNRVFNIGLPKTATHSLHSALEILGLRSLHNPQDLRSQTLAGCYRFDRDDWRALTNFCEHCYPQLDKEYPRSKFILTIRDKESWLDSWERQVNKGEELARKSLVSRLVSGNPIALARAVRRRLSSDLVTTPRVVRVQIFGCYSFNRDRASYVYDLHYKNALEYFARRPRDLLVMDIPGGDGWGKLCDFLSLPTPDRPFPHHYAALRAQRGN